MNVMQTDYIIEERAMYPPDLNYNNNPYLSQLNYNQPLQQTFNNAVNRFADYAIEKNIRQTIQQDLLREYDFIIQEAHWLLNMLYNNQYNSLSKDSSNLYLTFNGKDFINKLDSLSEIELELANVLSREVKIVKDTKAIVELRRQDPQKIYLPLFLIRSKIEPILVFDIYDEKKDGGYYFNLFTYTDYLSLRLSKNNRADPLDFEKIKKYSFESVPLNQKDLYLELHATYFIKLFLSVFTLNNRSDYIEEWLTYFFKTLRRVRNNLVLIGNRDVSEEIFYNKIIQHIFGFDYCISITDEMLENLSVGQIVQNKLFLHINHIPESEKLQKKLKDLLEGIIVYNNISENNIEIPFLCQIIFTLDAPHPFLYDFLSHSKVIFIDSIDNINLKLNQPDRISLLNNISNNLTGFSQQLASIDVSKIKQYDTYSQYLDLTPKEAIDLRDLHHSDKSCLNDTVTFNTQDFESDNEYFKNWLKDPALMAHALNFNSNKPVLDPFHDSFEKILPTEERYKHTYITGKTGSGKSELIKSLIYRDIERNDSSIILLDIHGDLANQVTKLVKDTERLVLIDPTLESDMTPTINLFRTKDKSEENVEQVSQMITAIINEINVGEAPSGTMIDMLENCIPLLVRSNHKDFYDLKRLIRDVPKVAGTKDEKVRIQQIRDEIKYQIDLFPKNKFEEEYFEDDFMEVSNSTRQAIRRRLNKILKDSKFSNLTNGESTIDLAKEMNTKGRIIIFHIPKSKMLNTYKYYVKFIIGLIQIIALKRADIKDENKRPHTHLYIDEFHNFITPTIEEILTESRKYKLFLTFAHQSISQIKDANLRDIILDNTNVKIVGKNSNKTLDLMNKTLNTKLEDVENLTAGEFNLQSGTNKVMRIRNSNKLLEGIANISDEEWQESKKYQIETYYRSTLKVEVVDAKGEELNEMIDEFIRAVKSKDLSESSCFRKIKDLDPRRYEEIEDDFKKDRIRQQEISTVFQLAFEQQKLIENGEFTKMLRDKNEIFNEAKMQSQDKKYRGKKQEKYYLIPTLDEIEVIEFTE